MPKLANLVVVTVDVLCPHCHEPQSEPVSGSHMWTIEDCSKSDAPVTCAYCNTTFLIRVPKRLIQL